MDMGKIIMTVGLPASGKTTRAKEKVKNSGGRIKRINKDDLRSMIDGGSYSKANENHIISARNLLVEYLYKEGLDIIIDDTNLNPEHHKYFQKMYGSDVSIQSFLDVPVDVCLERDYLRECKVGESVIKRMSNELNKHKSYFDLLQYKYTPNKDKPSAYIFDIDGTLALMNGRSPYDWKRVGEDSYNLDVGNICSIISSNNKIIIFSGRDSCCRQETIDRLHKYGIDFYEGLYMRPEGDCRSDWIVKLEMFRNIADKYNIQGVFDDRQQVVDMRRSIGLTCFQVAPGNF